MSAIDILRPLGMASASVLMTGLTMMFILRLALPHWFNPMTWIALRHIEKNAELACDDIVCTTQEVTTDYAKALLKMGIGKPSRAVFFAGANGSPCASRIRRVLSDDAHCDPRWKRWVVLLFAAIFLVADTIHINVVAQQSSAQETHQEPKIVESDVKLANPSEQQRAVTVSDESFEQAVKQLRDIGGVVRSHFPRTSTKNWVLVILDANEMKSPADDEAMDAVKLLSTDSDTHFQARYCEFSADGLAKLAGTKISRLELTGPNITDAHLKVLKGFLHLDKLSITDSSVSEAGLVAIADCQQLTSVRLGQNTEVGDSSLAILSRVPKLTAVSLSRNLTKVVVAELNKTGKLKSLGLTIADDDATEAFMGLECFESLEILELSGQLVNESMLVFLTERAPNLRNLSLSGSQDVSVPAVQALAKLPLEVLAVDNTNISDAGVSLLKPLKNLRWLDLSGTKVSDRCLIAIGNMDKLRFLSLARTDVSESGLERLRRLENLTTISLAGTAVRSIPVWMKQRQRLRVTFDGRRLVRVGSSLEGLRFTFDGGRPLDGLPPNAKDDSGLANAVAKFNKVASKHRIGKFEPPLTVDEVIAAIRSWNRRTFPVQDEMLAIFEQIADTRMLPDGANIDSTSGWRTAEYEYTVWWIDLTVAGPNNPGYTYRLRARTLSSQELEK